MVNNLIGLCCWWPARVCGSSLIEVQWFLKWEYHSDVLGQFSSVSLNVCCSISSISMAVLQSFRRTYCKHIAPSTHPFHSVTGGKTRLHCRSTHPWLNEPTTRFSGMWCQTMLLNILRGCHFDMSSFAIRNSVPDNFDQLLCNHNWYQTFKGCIVMSVLLVGWLHKLWSVMHIVRLDCICIRVLRIAL
jgi:hypothetical protein